MPGQNLGGHLSPENPLPEHLDDIPVLFRAGIPSRYVTSQLGQLSLAPLLGRLIEYQLRLG